MRLLDMIVMDHSYGGMIAYVGEWHEEVHGFMRNQVGRVALTYL